MTIARQPKHAKDIEDIDLPVLEPAQSDQPIDDQNGTVTPQGPANHDSVPVGDTLLKKTDGVIRPDGPANHDSEPATT